MPMPLYIYIIFLDWARGSPDWVREKDGWLGGELCNNLAPVPVTGLVGCRTWLRAALASGPAGGVGGVGAELSGLDGHNGARGGPRRPSRAEAGPARRGESRKAGAGE